MRSFLSPWVFSICLITVLGSARPALASELDYPELSVTPRASERLNMEAQQEEGRKWTTHIPLQVSAATTLFTALVLKDKNDSPARLLGTLTGIGWLGGSALLALYYHPYTSGLSAVNSMSKGSHREQLYRERMAEESIDSAASMGKRIMWLSTLSNAAISAYMVVNSDKGSMGQYVGAFSIVAAFAPIVFHYHWQDVANEQHDYRKRIYGPITSATIYTDPNGRNPAPGVALTFAY